MLAVSSSFLPKLQTQRTEEKQTKTASSEKGEQSSTNTMARARPNAIAPEPHAAAAAAATMTTTSTSRGADAGRHQQQDQERPAVLTVWRKSLLLSCSGFTVYDADGALAFRVDCYDSARRGLRRRAGDVVLMDVAGTPLLTVRRRSRLTSLGLAPDRWLIFDGDAAAAGAGCRGPNKAKPFLSVRRARLGLGLLGASSSGKAPLAYVTPLQAQAGEAYVVEGSYGARACAVRDARGDAVAEVRRKERVGDDVFRLVAGPRLGAPLAMALVIALDEMFAAAGAAAVPAATDVVSVVLVTSRRWRRRAGLYGTDQSMHLCPCESVTLSAQAPLHLRRESSLSRLRLQHLRRLASAPVSDSSVSRPPVPVLNL